MDFGNDPKSADVSLSDTKLFEWAEKISLAKYWDTVSGCCKAHSRLHFADLWGFSEVLKPMLRDTSDKKLHHSVDAHLSDSSTDVKVSPEAMAITTPWRQKTPSMWGPILGMGSRCHPGESQQNFHLVKLNEKDWRILSYTEITLQCMHSCYS